jgi:hypothetical protein
MSHFSRFRSSCKVFGDLTGKAPDKFPGLFLSKQLALAEMLSPDPSVAPYSMRMVRPFSSRNIQVNLRVRLF